MRMLADIIVGVMVIGSALAFSVGWEWVGAVTLSMAGLVFWKRDWCLGCIVRLNGGGGDRAPADAHGAVDAGFSSSDSGDSGGGGD